MSNPVITPDDVPAPASADLDPADEMRTAARVAMIETDGPRNDLDLRYKFRNTGDDILYRHVVNTRMPAIDVGLVICRTHLVELRAYRFHDRSLHVRAIGPRERMYSIDPPMCGMCAAVISHGNVCYNDDCKTPLHPQWPAVYCSNECALSDR